MQIKPFSFVQPLRKILFASDTAKNNSILQQNVGQLCKCFFKEPVDIITISSLSFAMFKKAGDPIFMDKLPIYSIIHIVQQQNSIAFEVLTRLDLNELIMLFKQDTYQEFYHENRQFNPVALEQFEKLRSHYIQNMFTGIIDRLFQQIFVATEQSIPQETLNMFSVVKAEHSNFYRILLAKSPKETLQLLKMFRPRFLLSGTGYFVYNKTVFSDPFMLDLVYSYLNIDFDDLLTNIDYDNIMVAKIGYRTEHDAIATLSEVQQNFTSGYTNTLKEQSIAENFQSDNLLECKLLNNFTSFILKNFAVKCNTLSELQNFFDTFVQVMKCYKGSYGSENLLIKQVENGCLVLLEKPFCIEISSILGFALCSILRNNQCSIYIFYPNISSAIDFEKMLNSSFLSEAQLIQSLDLCNQQQQYEFVINTYIKKCFAPVDRYFYANSLLLVKGQLDSKLHSQLSSFAHTQLCFDGSTTIALLRNINQNSSIVLVNLKNFLQSLAHYNYYNFERNLIRAFSLIDFNILGQFLLPFLKFTNKAQINFQLFDQIIEKTKDIERRNSNQLISSKQSITQQNLINLVQPKLKIKSIKESESESDPEFDLFSIDFEPALSNQFQHFLFHGNEQNIVSFMAFLEQFQQIESSAFALTIMRLDGCFLFVQTRKVISPLSYQWFLFTSSASICHLVFYELRNIKNKHNMLHLDLVELYEHVRCDNSIQRFPLLLTYHIEQFIQKAFKEVEILPTAIVLYSTNLNENLINEIGNYISCDIHLFQNRFVVMSKIEWTDIRKIKFGEILQELSDFTLRAFSRYYLSMIQTVMIKPIFMELLSKFFPNLPTNCIACRTIFSNGIQKPDLTIEQLHVQDQQQRSNYKVNAIEPVPGARQGNCSIGIFDQKGMHVPLKEPQITFLPRKQEVKRLMPVQVYEHDDNQIISQFNCRTLESLEILIKEQRDEIDYLRSCVSQSNRFDFLK